MSIKVVLSLRAEQSQPAASQDSVDQSVECPSHDVDVSHENTTFRNLIFERKSEFSVTHLFISTLTIFLVSYN